MFTYFFSLAIIAFEVICCKIFFESFCDSSGENRKYKRTILLVLLIAIYYICGFTLSKWIVLKQLCAIMSTAIIMRFYFEISLVKSAVFAILYQGLLMLVDYLVYAGNSAIVSREGIDLPQCSLRYNAVGIMTLEFLIVTCKMLDGAGDTVFSHAGQLCCCHDTGEIRVFRKILKVTTVQWIPVDIDAGS